MNLFSQIFLPVAASTQIDLLAFARRAGIGADDRVELAAHHDRRGDAAQLGVLPQHVALGAPASGSQLSIEARLARDAVLLRAAPIGPVERVDVGRRGRHVERRRTATATRAQHGARQRQARVQCNLMTGYSQDVRCRQDDARRDGSVVFTSRIRRRRGPSKRRARQRAGSEPAGDGCRQSNCPSAVRAGSGRDRPAAACNAAGGRSRAGRPVVSQTIRPRDRTWAARSPAPSSGRLRDAARRAESGSPGRARRATRWPSSSIWASAPHSRI